MALTPRLGVLGGTFDPPHRGHIAVASEVRHRLRLDVVLFVVANEPWQKSALGLVTPAGLRLEMTRAALVGHDGMEASALDIDRGGPTYMADTLTELGDSYPSAELFLVVGSDLARRLDTWKRSSEIESRATTVVVERPCGGRAYSAASSRPPAGWRHIFLTGPAIDISSADIRAGYSDNRSVGAMIPTAVEEIIRARGLYRCDL